MTAASVLPPAPVASPLEALNASLAGIARDHGCEGAVYMHLGHGLVSLQDATLRSQPLRLLATPGFEAAQYVRHDYLAFDPLAARAYSAYLPFAWTLAELDDPSPSRRRLLAMLSNCGMQAGLVAPVQDHALGPAFVNVFTRDLSSAETDRGRLAMAAAALHVEAIATLAPSTANSDARLSPREIAVLRLAALGRTEQETALALALSRRGVQFHLSRVVEKLGAPNKTAAVALALNVGLIRL